MESKSLGRGVALAPFSWQWKWCWPILALFVVIYGLKDSIKEGLKTHEPFRSIYVWFFNPKVSYLAPDEVGDGKQAVQIILQDPAGIAVDQAGRVYISDRGRYLWRVDRDGAAHIIAGTGKKGSVSRRISARYAEFGSPEGICLDEAGNLYFADWSQQVVLKLDRRGVISRIAGNGAGAYDGDGRPAIKAALNQPYDVACDSVGNLYIADFGNHRIRKVDHEGRISTVVGTGVAGYSGDGGPGIEAQINGPYGVFVDAQDNLLIADSLNHVIRKIDADGEIRTIAGTGEQGYSGDGGPALAARFDTPQSIFVDVLGRLYVSDEHNHCIRLIDRKGTIYTLVGNGRPGDSADGTAASQAQLNDPEDIWVRRDGTVLIADGDNRRVRVISAGGLMSTFAGRGRWE